MTSAVYTDAGLPLVGEETGNRSLWLGLCGILCVGGLLFYVLESNRQSTIAPRVTEPSVYAAATVQQPSLTIPNEVQAPVYRGLPLQKEPLRGSTLQSPLKPAKLPPVRLTSEPQSRPPRVISQPPYPASQYPVVSPALRPTPAPLNPGRTAQVIVYDIAASALPAPPAPTPPPINDSFTRSTRAAAAFATPAADRYNVVAQGTLIYAVLETALNSTQPGQARALISKNVYNADGTKILIPKGSRVFGEYRANLGEGQNRAQVIWGRLVRPDGATITLDSPASDQLGRAGIKGSVDTHFGERLLSALLQSTIDFGSAAASQAVSRNNGVIVALPNSSRISGPQIFREAPRPTLKVKHGTRIAVFVARDLDFTAVE
jgi:type IV secretion system protein VirB10